MKSYPDLLEEVQELRQQNAGLRASMADASTLLDQAYGASGERLERRIARLITIEQQQRAALQMEAAPD